MDVHLKLNPRTGYYEVTLRVEVEVLRRTLFTYLDEHNIDPTDIGKYQAAVEEVTRLSKWVNHPRVQFTQLPPEPPRQALPMPPEKAQEIREPPAKAEATPVPSSRATKRRLSETETKALREKALALPVEQWSTLLAPIPQGLGHRSYEKQSIYDLRYAQNVVLKALKKEMEPVDPERMAAITEVVNGARMK